MPDPVPVRVTAVRWCGVVAAPFAATTVYLWLSRWPWRWFTDLSDCVALAAVLAIFAICVGILPLPRKTKLLAIALALPFLAVALAAYALIFVGLAFGDWI